MVKGKYLLISTVIGMAVIQLTGHKNGSVERLPRVSDTGRRLEDFVPEGWELLDSVALDFNEDGIPDYVGVLEAAPIDMGDYSMCPDYPRILFAIASDGTERYRLDFQDINLIRKRYDEGNNLPLTAEGLSFTTHAAGGKAWNWSEDYTYTYREGTWWLTLSEETSGYGEYVGEYITSYSKDDWERGVGIRQKRSSEFDDMEENWESEEYDVVYELSLDEPLTIEQAGKRCHRAPVRVTDWAVEVVTFAEDVELSEDMIKLPEEAEIRY